jgi:hypothetical protein
MIRVLNFPAKKKKSQKKEALKSQWNFFLACNNNKKLIMGFNFFPHISFVVVAHVVVIKTIGRSKLNLATK